MQGHNNVNRVRVEPRSCDQRRCENDTFTFSTTLLNNAHFASEYDFYTPDNLIYGRNKLNTIVWLGRDLNFSRNFFLVFSLIQIQPTVTQT